MMMWTDDPIADAERYYTSNDKKIEKLPRCSECDCHIVDEYAYYINDEWICDDCMDSYKREVLPE